MNQDTYSSYSTFDHTTSSEKPVRLNLVKFENKIFYFASGILAISFAFIGNVIHIQRAESKPFLIYSWILFSMAVFICLCAILLVNDYAADHELEKKKSSIESYNTTIEKRNNTIFTLSLFAILFLLVGMILLLSFIGKNI